VGSTRNFGRGFGFRGVVQRLGLRLALKREALKGRRKDVTVAEAQWFCYMVRCRDASLYVGIATDVDERVKRHNWGIGPEYTAKRRPVVLIWSQCCGSPEAARRREKEIKGWSRKKKFELVKNGGGMTHRVNPSPASRALGKGESSNG
jgi:putative endonuclease